MIERPQAISEQPEMAQGGLVIWHMLRSPRLARGSAARERVLSRLSDQQRRVLEYIRPADWIDERLTVALTEAIVAELPLADDEAIRKYFRDQQLMAYSRVYRMVLPFLSPMTLLGRAPWFWRRQHRSGELIVDDNGSDWASGRIVRHPPITHPHYALAVLSGVEATVALTGVSPVRGEIVEMGDDWTRFEVTWGPRAPAA